VSDSSSSGNLAMAMDVADEHSKSVKRKRPSVEDCGKEGEEQLEAKPQVQPKKPRAPTVNIQERPRVTVNLLAALTPVVTLNADVQPPPPGIFAWTVAPNGIVTVGAVQAPNGSAYTMDFTPVDAGTATVTARYTVEGVSASDTADIVVRALPTLAIAAPKIVGIGARLNVTVGTTAAAFDGTAALDCSHRNQVALYDPNNTLRNWPATITLAELTAGVAFTVQGAVRSGNADEAVLTLTLQGGTVAIGAAATDSMTVTEVKLQYNNGTADVDVAGTLFILLGSSVQFSVVTTPNVGCGAGAVWSGTSGATGTANTLTVTFNAQSANAGDFMTVVARCRGADVTANVVVFALTGVFTPQDNFANRSTTDYGLAEVVALTCTIAPVITVVEAGRVRWVVVNGNSALTNVLDDGTATLTAHHTAEALRLRLSVVAGPCANRGTVYDKTIVAPNDALMVLASNIRHTQGKAGVGFKGINYLRPTDVSFQFITFREGGGNANATGFYAALDGDPHDTTPFAIAILGGDANNGCRVTGQDEVDSNDWSAPFSDGTFNWPIDWQYNAPGGGGWVTFTVATHAETINAVGTTTIQKKGAGPFQKLLNDATSTF
jgi:hypothetical protein